MAEEKFSFQANRENIPIPQTVKLDNKKSRYGRQMEERAGAEQTKIAFEKRAEEAHDRILDRNYQMLELGKRFVEIMRDRTLDTNKGPIQKSLEKETLDKLIQFAIELNNDELEVRDGMGAVGLLTLLFRTNLLMRDKCNSLEYRVEQLEKALNVERKT
jgi:hypothetical protein